jgi:creatinine amidohydrolase/Fe(II)-dependent formamide hydrolase-like protein
MRIRRTMLALGVAALLALPALAQTSSIEFELMTWPEVKAALAAGKTTALFYTGGTEQRGPQAVNGGHTLMAKAIVKTMAEKLRNAIAMPVLPFTSNAAAAALPGTIGLTDATLAAVLERVSEQAIVDGFKNVILMGDHGSGQPMVYRSVAQRLNMKYSARGVHVYYCDAVYSKAEKDFDAWLTAHGYPLGTHAGIADTSEMLYLGGEAWVRKDRLPDAVGTSASSGNGVAGDARKASAEIGKVFFEMKVDAAVTQIRSLVSGSRK